MISAQKNETRHADNERPGPDGFVSADDANFAEHDAKRLANIRASLAIKGYAVVPMAGALVISRWGMCRIVDSVDDLADFARQVGVQP